MCSGLYDSLYALVKNKVDENTFNHEYGIIIYIVGNPLLRLLISITGLQNKTNCATIAAL